MNYSLQLVRDLKGVFNLVEVPLEKVVPKHVVRVKLITATLCGTDIDIASGNRADSAKILGHEGYGEVIDIGNEVRESLQIGDKVCFNPVNPSNQDDVLGHSFDGIFRSIIDINLDKHSQLLVKLPMGWNNELASILEPISVAEYVKENIVQIKNKCSVLIIGSGGMSQILSIYLEKHDFTVTLYSISEEEFYNKKNEIVEGSDRQYQVVIICVPRQKALFALEFSYPYIEDNGILYSLSGFEEPKSSKNDFQIVNRLINVRRDNFCGIKNNIFPISFYGKKVFVSGQRGSGYHHFERAISHLCLFNNDYKSVISERIKFGELDSYINKKCFYRNKTRGKTLINFFDGESYEN